MNLADHFGTCQREGGRRSLRVAWPSAMMSETEAFYHAKPSDRDKGGFDLAEKNGWLTCSTARSLINPGADANFWKCDLCDQKKKEATRSIAYDQYKSHLLRCHDDQDSSPPGTLTPAETCFPVSTAKHRAKNAVKSEGKEVAKAAKTAKTVQLLPTLADAYDALVAAGFTATAGEMAVLSTEVKKRTAPGIAPGHAPNPAKRVKKSELERLGNVPPPTVPRGGPARENERRMSL